MKELILSHDPYRMNWIEGHTEWGTVRAPEGLSVSYSSKRQGDDVYESFTFTNVSKQDIFTSLTDISIYVPFNDDYTTARECMTNRCHTHLWCGDNITYIMALRMGGKAPHLGLVLTEGSIGGYSVERDLSRSSNDRGDFILHPSPTALIPGQSLHIAWRLFAHNGKADFYKKLRTLCPRYIRIRAENYVVFMGETIHIEITPAEDFTSEDVSITRDGTSVPFSVQDGVISLREEPRAPGEFLYAIHVGPVKTHCRILAVPKLMELAKRRCHFIASMQQYHNPQSGLDGAYLVYDNEEKHMYYNANPDYDGGRERIGMGLLIARCLKHQQDPTLENSLLQYADYVKRELFNPETGEVYNDYGHNNTQNRLYNYPWMSRFFLELFELYGDDTDLQYAYLALKSFYAQGGSHFYAFEIPVISILLHLKNHGWTDRYAELLERFTEHSAFMLQNGLNYPAHEVNYEQSIVAPAAEMLLQMYRVSRDPKYLDGARVQVRALELFNGLQPDYHLYEVAIRHWDGFWFGKRKLYGDTYPHYWSALTANVYADFAELTQDEEYRKKAEAAYRGVLCLTQPDGSASCAYVYPVTVNGRTAEFFDPYANDQDWGLYFLLRHRSEETRR